MGKKWLIAVSLYFVVQILVLSNCYAQDQRFRGVWLTDVCSNVLDSDENIRTAVRQCKETKINHIFVAVWNRGQTIYPSNVVQSITGVEIMNRFKGRDPLSVLIKEAHNVGIKVHAWFEFGFSSSYDDSTGGAILRNRPHWRSLDVNGKLLTKNKFQWMSAFNPEVQKFVTELIFEVIDNYDVDGVQGDDRLPALPSSGGYDDYTIGLYKKEHGVAPPEDYKDERWIQWRCDILSDFLERLTKRIKEKKPKLIVSISPSIYPWCKYEYLQDWPEWLRRCRIDMVIPQVYRRSYDAYKEELIRQIEVFKNTNSDALFIPGVLVKVENEIIPNDQMFVNILKLNDSLGLGGECLFYYEGIANFYRILKNN